MGLLDGKVAPGSDMRNAIPVDAGHLLIPGVNANPIRE
jgi:hypothetical protein